MSDGNERKMKKTILEYALEYHKRGWNIIPIGFEKKPQRGFSWILFQTKRVTEDDLQNWFGNGKVRNLAVVVGEVSGGLTVLDFDSMDLYAQWKSKNTALAESLPTVKTSRGMHVYFRSELKKSKQYNRIDLIAANKYVLLPPSLHPDNKTIYEWVIPPNGELPEHNPHTWGLDKLTEDIEDTEDIEEIEAINIHVDKCTYLSDFLKKNNFNEKISEKIIEAIVHTLPKTKGERNQKKLFYFCRWLKGILELAELPVKELRPIVQEWHQKALPVIGTKPFVTTWADFTYGWLKVKWPKGTEILKKAVDNAHKANDILPEAKEYDKKEVQLLVRVCYELQKLQGEEPFWIACRDAGGIVGVSHKTANKYLHMLVADEILEVAKKHTTTEATRYKYVANTKKK